jgi:hypothetical protein
MDLGKKLREAMAKLTNRPYVDEDDVGNLVAELMLKWLSGGQPVTFLEHYEHHPEWILLGVDGFVPGQMVEGKPQVKPISTVLLDGLVFCSRMKTGHDAGLPVRGRRRLPGVHDPPRLWARGMQAGRGDDRGRCADAASQSPA